MVFSSEPRSAVRLKWDIPSLPEGRRTNLHGGLPFPLSGQGRKVIVRGEEGTSWPVASCHAVQPVLESQALAFRLKSLKPFKLVSLRSEAAYSIPNATGQVRNHPRANRCRATMAHTRQSKPDSGLGFQVEVFKPFKLFPHGMLNPGCHGAGAKPPAGQGS